MKYLSLVIIAFAYLLLGVKAFALTPEERATVERMRDVTIELRESLTASQKANASALLTIQATTERADAAAVAARAAADAAAALTAERDGLTDKVRIKDAKIAADKLDHDRLLANYHTFKFYTGGALGLLAAFCVGLLIFRFAAPALNTLPGCVMAFGVPSAVGAAVFAFILTL